MRTTLLLFILLTSSFLQKLQAQITLTGQVVDEHQQPVPYASVGLENGSAGTATNEIGEFSLRVPSLPQHVVVQSIGYARTMVEAQASNTPLTIVLPVSVVQLSEVRVRNPHKVAEELVARAYAKLLRHHKDEYYGKAFYRQKTLTNSRYHEFFDAFYDIKFTNQRIEGWDLGETRYAYTVGSGPNFTNFSALIRRVPLYSTHPTREKVVVPLRAQATELFDFTVRNTLTENGRELAVIDYAPKDTRIMTAASGTLYIDVETATVRRQEMTFPLDNIITFDVPDDVQPQKTTFRLVSDFVVVSDSLTRLASSRADGRLVLRQGKAVDSTHVAGYLFLYQYTPRLPSQTYASVARRSNDLQQVKAKPYNANFWRDNAIIKTSPVEEKIIRDMEGKKIFGTFLEGK